MLLFEAFNYHSVYSVLINCQVHVRTIFFSWIIVVVELPCFGFSAVKLLNIFFVVQRCKYYRHLNQAKRILALLLVPKSLMLPNLSVCNSALTQIFNSQLRFTNFDLYNIGFLDDAKAICANPNYANKYQLKLDLLVRKQTQQLYLA